MDFDIMEILTMKISDTAEYGRHIKNIIITEDAIQQAVEKAAEELSVKYRGKPLLLVSVLKGAFIFLSDLSKRITIPCEIGFMAAKSYYEGTTSSGELRITMDLQQDISGYHVVIIEDIVDTGVTLSRIVEMLKERSPLSLEVITLLDKPSRRKVNFEPDKTLFSIPDLFVVGYGLDYGEYYRNLPYIAEYSTDN